MSHNRPLNTEVQQPSCARMTGSQRVLDILLSLFSTKTGREWRSRKHKQSGTHVPRRTGLHCTMSCANRAPCLSDNCAANLQSGKNASALIFSALHSDDQDNGEDNGVHGHYQEGSICSYCSLCKVYCVNLTQ